ncbi:Hypothetical predicted protein [Mytilus galloprovincialis]|uniref:Uncharacterized protein n=1 Tax=Mytilus galloprovincialis TaxID=29158 RepID=A0A8B6EIH4_MYTGA|nr:Hypothetical predicted protein [Mytilus galloprovincialis]
MSFALSCLNSLNEHNYATPNKTAGYTHQLATSTPIYPPQYLQYPPPQPKNVHSHVHDAIPNPLQTQQSPPLLPHQQPNDFSMILTEELSRLNCLDQKLGRLDEIDKKLLKLDTVSTNLGKINNQVKNLDGKLATVNKRLGDVEKSSVFVSDNERLRSSVLDLQCQKLNENLVFNGIDEQTGEVTDDVVKAFVRTELEIVREIPIVKSYRIGKHFDGKIRPIVKFENRNDRQDIRFAAPKHLKGKPFGVNEHFPHEVVKIRKELLPIHKEARKQNLKSVLKRDKLYIDGELFDKSKHSHLIKQPEAMDEGALKVVETGTRTDGKFSYQIVILNS